MRILTLPLLVLLSACVGNPLAPTPNLYIGGDPAYSELPEALQSSEVELLYVTDRVPEGTTVDDPQYGFRRSESAAWGLATVRFGKDTDWPTLVAASTGAGGRGGQRPQLSLTQVTELGRFPPTPWPYTVVDDQVVEDEQIQADHDRQVRQIRARLHPLLRESPRKDVLVFVHGFNNDFTDSALTLAQLWHMLGRQDVPILYSWPAGHGGLGGYGYDRESGQFTAFHLKNFLRFLAADPEIEHLQLVAHSRGSDVLMTAIKDLTIEARAAGLDPRTTNRIANVVLAAPDLDIEVVSQRLAAERIGRGVGRLTVYTSANDKALGLSHWLFGGLTRAGLLRRDDVRDHAWRVLQGYDNFEIIDYRGQTRGYGHGYFRDSPGVSSDLIKLIRDGAPPGTEHGRPLNHIDGHFWSLDDDYLLGDRAQ
jgi:esterase/lipase superfamily enzyme